jgi:hypothetical protein
LTFKGYWRVVGFYGVFFSREVVVARNTSRNPIVFRAKIPIFEKSSP